ncbi:MAG TPA: serine/threonine-protein kinase [Candidatus Sulfotelmatobacter sp.]|nr:serine/threonine-protein kinase [Candidatus Sulfotelmatobacter sp.]
MANGVRLDASWVQAQFPDLTNIAALSPGGQKIVFAATHPIDGDVVLKLINPGQPNETTDREVLAVQIVQSPRVPRILEQGRIRTAFGELVWLREQRIIGQTVRQALAGGRFDKRRLLRLGLHVLEALLKAEEAQIVHRDIKPDNVILDGSDDYWLLDFGIARHLTLKSLTGTGQIWGKFTLGYSPPEQMRNLKPQIDSRADLFALGVTLHECATGRHPFREPPAADLEILKRVETLTLTPLNLMFPAANEFRDLVEAMTQKRRDLRPGSVKEALAWMQEICAKEQV